MTVLALLLVALPVAADDLRAADRLLCAAIQAHMCSTEGRCETAPPWTWNMPEFLEVDLTAKKVRTTPTSNERRETPLGSVLRAEGLIVLQGFELGRAFSVLINESTGDASLAVARDNLTVTVFGSCIPMGANH